RLKLVSLTLAPEVPHLAPGEIRAGKNSVHVGTGSHPVELGWVQPQGKKPMRAADWARGVRPAVGERVGG
ncbi:methionyl-tRNA formyltransferase, partial [Streptomyces sp. SID11233]|nr:methionyl-tRNA formyltransferase [Streptomyces sp. SID11233]